jgi:hypothetical protein
MNNRYLLSLATALILGATAVTAWAQDETDALRYSQLAPSGTARSMGFGSALGSVGADFTSLSVNPAGIGVYRSSELLFTPSIKIGSTNGSYLGSSSSDNVNKFNINNFGMVFTNAKQGARYEKSKWKSASFAIGFNKLADFHRNYNYSGFNSGNSSSSGSEVFVADANLGSDPEDVTSLAGMGYQAYLLEYDTAMGGFYTVVPYKAGIKQQRNVTERGRYNEMVISFGGNYMEKLLLGATIGIPTIKYERSSTYKESTTNTSISDNPFGFNEYSYREDLLTKGTGVNLKLGFIYKATDQFRFGAAIHTPTAFSLNDVYEYKVDAQFNMADPFEVNSGGAFSYMLTTPWRGVLSATGIIGKLGFVTADYEYVGYNSARYNMDDDNAEYESYINGVIRSTYKGASNIRLGAEVRPMDIMMVRVGFGYYGSPYKKAAVNGDRIDVSAGLGFRFQDWFIDFGYVNSSYKQGEQPYVLPYEGVIVPTATLRSSKNNAALTVGFKF